MLLDPPVPNFLFFEDTDDFKCAAIDYAGLADSFLRSGTTMSGLVRQRERADGRGVDVEIFLETENALAWVAENCGLQTMLFGYRVSEVLAGAQPVFGKSSLHVRMIHPRFTGDLPDLFQLYLFPEGDRFLTSVFFTASAQGTLRVAFNGLPAGTPVRLTVSSVQDFFLGGFVNTQIQLLPLAP